MMFLIGIMNTDVWGRMVSAIRRPMCGTQVAKHAEFQTRHVGKIFAVSTRANIPRDLYQAPTISVFR